MLDYESFNLSTGAYSLARYTT